MRANVAEYEIIAPATLDDALATLAEGAHTPIAGGTELMVALAAGRLARRPLLSLHRLTLLRFIDVTPEAITLGAATTFTDIRQNAAIAADLPLLAQAASWTGSLANQNRGTLGGNIVNASPAADSPPALLCYGAVLTLISASGRRTVPYSDFHQGYKKTALMVGELVESIRVERRFAGYTQYIRKVGARNAQAISKIALAGVGVMANGLVRDVRLAAASLRDIPLRLAATQRVLLGSALTPATVMAARAALLEEAKPIDDIRSTGSYRGAVAANLLEEFVQQLASSSR